MGNLQIYQPLQRIRSIRFNTFREATDYSNERWSVNSNVDVHVGDDHVQVDTAAAEAVHVVS